MGAFVIASVFFYPLWNSSINTTTTTNQVMAQTIGSIMESTGEFSILSNGRTIQSNTIQIKDVITLEKWATITILINDSFQTEIIWPASFEIVPVTNNNRTLYNLKFNNGGDFVAINTKNQKENTEISVQTTQGVVIKNKNVSQEMNNIAFTVIGSSDGGNTTILNKSNVEIEASKLASGSTNEPETSITIAPTQIAELSQSNTAHASGNQDLQLLQVKPLESSTEQALLAEINWWTSDKIPTIVKTTTTTPANTETEPQWLSVEVQHQIEQNLYKSFVKNDIENIITYHLLWNKSASEISRNNLLNRITRISKLLNIPLRKGPDSIDNLINAIDEIQINFSKQYPEELGLLRNLSTAKAWLEVANIYEFGGHKDIQANSWSRSLDEITTLLKIKKWERQYKFR